MNQCDKPRKRIDLKTGQTMTLFYTSSQKNEWLEWYIGKRPFNSKAGLSVEHDYARFTPDIAGDYDVVVESYSKSLGLVDQRTYLYNAVGSPVYSKFIEPEIIIPDSNKKEPDSQLIATVDSSTIKIDSIESNSKTDTIVEGFNSNFQKNGNSEINSSKTDLYTIQVFSIPDKKQALGKLNILSNNGFPGYVTEFVHPNTQTTWYRIRVGKYSNYESADSVAQLVEKNLSLSTWIDRLGD